MIFEQSGIDVNISVSRLDILYGKVAFHTKLNPAILVSSRPLMLYQEST